MESHGLLKAFAPSERYDQVCQAADPRAVALFEDALVWDTALPWGAMDQLR